MLSIAFLFYKVYILAFLLIILNIVNSFNKVPSLLSTLTGRGGS